MLSGGLDSTAVLYKLLKETREPIHVHHIVLRNAQRRWEVENQACKRILLWCKQNLRDFKTTVSTFGFTHFSNFICWDNDVVRFTAAQIAQDNPDILYVALGKCLDDDIDGSFDARSEQSKRIWEACFHSYPYHIPEIIRPVSKMTKGQLWNYLPEKLRKMTWSCRTPDLSGKEPKICGSCKTCGQNKKYGISNSQSIS